jgi:hypothetical protein
VRHAPALLASFSHTEISSEANHAKSETVRFGFSILAPHCNVSAFRIE